MFSLSDREETKAERSSKRGQRYKGGEMKTIKLPDLKYEGIKVEEALRKRRSTRKFKDEMLTLMELSQLLWACDGKNVKWGGRTAPSAGATYPMELYVISGEVEGLEKGLYHYNVPEHSLTLVKTGDLREEISKGALNQNFIAKAPAVIIISGILERTTKRYGKRGERYVYMEAGHCGQNLHIQAESLGLGTVMVGAFEDEVVAEILGIKEDIFYICPVGKK